MFSISFDCVCVCPHTVSPSNPALHPLNSKITGEMTLRPSPLIGFNQLKLMTETALAKQTSKRLGRIIGSI
jgi:hypothetical protein